MATTRGTGRRAPRALEGRHYPLWRLARAYAYDFRLLVAEARYSLGLFVLVVAIGTVYEHAQAHPGANVAGWFEALYNTLQLLIFQQGGATFPSDPLGIAIYFLLPLLGLVVIAQGVLNFGRRVLDKSSRAQDFQVSLASTYRDHIILCGLGRVGIRVLVRLLRAEQGVVVVERDWSARFVARALRYRVPVVVGDATDAATLAQARIGSARAVIAGVNGDLTNIEIGLAARALRPEVRVIVRAFSEELDANLERIFGPDSAFSTSALAAPTFAAGAVSREILYALPLGDQFIGLTRLTVGAAGGFAGPVGALEDAHGVRVLARRDRANRLALVDPGKSLQAGDRVAVLGALDALEAVRLANASAAERAALPLQHPTSQFDRVLVCGLGKIGYRVVRQLCQLPSHPAIVAVYLPDGPDSFAERVAGLDGVTLVEGDARDPAVLARAGLDRAYSVAAVTSDDLVNLRIGLAARGQRPDVHLVVRVFNDALVDELNSALGIHTTYSTSNLASPTLAAAGLLGGIGRAFVAGDTLFGAAELGVRAGDKLAGGSVAALRAGQGALVLGVQAKGESLVLPPRDRVLALGDTVTLVAPLDSLHRLRAHQKA